MATVIDKKQSTYGGPYAFYTLDLDYGSRTASSVVVYYTLKVNLQYYNSKTGYPLKATITVGGKSVEITLKGTETWSGTAVHEFTGSFTVTGLSNNTTSLSVYLKVTSTSGNVGGTLTNTQGSNLTIKTPIYTVSYNANGGSDAPGPQSYYYGGSSITLSTQVPVKSGYNFLGWSLSSSASSPSYYPGESWSSSNGNNYTLYAVWEVANGKSTISLSQSNINLNDNITVFINTMNAGNYHKIVWSYGSNSFISHTEATDNITLTLLESRFSSWFGTEKSINIKVTVTTYNSSGSSFGNSVAAFNLNLPELLGKPSKPTIVKREESISSMICDIVGMPEFKYGAVFSKWVVTTTNGTAEVNDNVLIASISNDDNKTIVVSVQAQDSRGFLSDPVNIVYHKHRKGVCVFKGDKFVKCIPYIYKDGAWVKLKQSYVYNEPRVLISKDGYILVDNNSLILKGGETWLNIR